MYLMATVKIKHPSILTKTKEKMQPNTNREIRTAPLSSRHIKKRRVFGCGGCVHSSIGLAFNLFRYRIIAGSNESAIAFNMRS